MVRSCCIQCKNGGRVTEIERRDDVKAADLIFLARLELKMWRSLSYMLLAIVVAEFVGLLVLIARAA